MHSRVLFVCSLLILGLALSARQDSDPAADAAPEITSSLKEATASAGSESRIVDIAALDYAFAGPVEIPSGWTTPRMPNQGEEHHVMVLTRLPEAQMLAGSWKRIAMAKRDTARAMHLIKSIRPTLDQVVLSGGPGLVAPGRVAQTAVYLGPGSYMMACGVRAPEGPLTRNSG